MDEKETVRVFYEEVVTRDERDRIGAYIAEDCVVRTGEDTLPMGVSGMREHLRATKATYPDYSVRILRQYQEAHTVISEFIMTGTHAGEFAGITPTNSVLSITGVNIDKVIDGKIVEHGGAANTFEAFLEHGLIRPR